MPSSLFPRAAPDFEAMSEEAGISRLYGGIHYRSDIVGGKAHGERVVAAVLRWAGGDGAR